MKNRFKSILYRWIAVIMCLIIILAAIFFRIKPLVFVFAKSTAETIMLNAANNAVLNVLEENTVKYDDIAHISRGADGSFLGVELDSVKINLIKSKISNEISSIVSKNNIYNLKIPIGTLTGSEYLTGFGPPITFKMQFTETSVLDFESSFESAGINQVLHQVLINIDISANILMMGCTKGFSVSTSAIAAQTAIVGDVPDSYTNVDEYPGGDIADEIFNYADLD